MILKKQSHAPKNSNKNKAHETKNCTMCAGLRKTGSLISRALVFINVELASLPNVIPHHDARAYYDTKQQEQCSVFLVVHSAELYELHFIEPYRYLFYELNAA